MIEIHLAEKIYYVLKIHFPTVLNFGCMNAIKDTDHTNCLKHEILVQSIDLGKF